MNKKAENWIVDFWAILVFIVIVVIFAILFWQSEVRSENEILASYNASDASTTLAMLLNHRVVYDGQNYTYHELVSLWHTLPEGEEEDELYTHLVQATDAYLRPVYGKCGSVEVQTSYLTTAQTRSSCAFEDIDSAEQHLVDLIGRPYTINLHACPFERYQRNAQHRIQECDIVP